MNRTHSLLKLWFDRLLSKSLVRQFFVLGALLSALFLISWGCLHLSGIKWEDFANHKAKDIPEFLIPLYLLIDTNAFNNLYIHGVNGWALFFSTLTFLIGAFVFNGIIISIITNFIEHRVQLHREGRIHYLRVGHYLIMGYDEMVPSIISHIFRKDADAYILLLSSEESEHLREKLHRFFDEKQMKKIIINYGYRTSENYYKDIHLETAEMVYVVGDRSLPVHDAMNVECMDSICRYLIKCGGRLKPKRITCVFEALDTYAAFKTSEIFEEVKKLDIEFVPYNCYAGWAKQVFVKRCYYDPRESYQKHQYPSVYGDGITPENPKYVHLVFVGTTNFAVAFAMEAAQVLHFPNFNTMGKRTRITFIDVNADKEKDEFITRNRHFFEVQPYWYSDLSVVKEGRGVEPEKCEEYVIFTEEGDREFLDVEFQFIKGDVFSKPVQDKISEWAGEHNKKQYLSIFLAQLNQRENFVMGMNMPDEVYDNAVNVFIRQDRSDNFVTNLRTTDMEKNLTYSKVERGKVKSESRHARFAHIYPFGMNETAYCEDGHSLMRAKLINYLYDSANYETLKFPGILVLDAMSEDKLWEEADKAWKRIKEPSVALKWSNLYNAYAIRIKLASLRAMRGLDVNDESHDTWELTDEGVKAMAIVEHNRWNVEKLLMGFRKSHKDEDKYANPKFLDTLKENRKLFIHHDIRPFDELDDVKELDKEFARYIPWIMKMTNENDR